MLLQRKEIQTAFKYHMNTENETSSCRIL